MYGGHFVLSFKNFSRVPSWHQADFSLGHLRDTESTKKLHNNNKTHFLTNPLDYRKQKNYIFFMLTFKILSQETGIVIYLC